MTKTTLRRLLGSGLAIAASAYGSQALAQVPQSITQQGRLYDANGQPITGPLDVAFSLYTSAGAATPIWSETHTITFDDGYFSVTLGTTDPLDTTVFDGSERHLGIKVGTDPEMTPRAAVHSVPYAILAGDVTGDIHPNSVIVNGTTVIDDTGAWVGGSSGLIGPTGPAGADGANGALGPTGPAGADGAIGATGPAGAKGATGATGAQGAAGAIGPTGPQGTAGAVGPTGPQGAVGAVGPTGPQGAVGAVGPTGAQGAAGAVGPTGPQGAVGAVGPTGPQGTQGIQGIQGIQGPAGAIGPTGPIGGGGQRYITISALTCVNQGTGVPQGDQGVTSCSSGTTRTDGTGNHPCFVSGRAGIRDTYVCPLVLPSGSTINEILGFGYDPSATGYIEAAGFYQANNSFGTIFFPAVWPTSGVAPAPGNVTLTVLSAPMAIDPTNSRYTLTFGIRETNVWFFGFRVSYTLN